ncbi:MAG: glycosyltransferase family 2 protein [Theionarchaea archaeon]|nr:glycosyltransferase family 2 protein [Theionarchaea archaeon]
MDNITVIIPAYNEADRIGPVISETMQYAQDILVIDDGSTDGTGEQAQALGAEVLYQSHEGYVQALKTGFTRAQGNIIVTLDADGEHPPSAIPSLIAPILQREADLVLGTRSHIPSSSEWFIGWLVSLQVKVQDHGTGFRALTKELAEAMELRGPCTCGTLVLQALLQGARIAEVHITEREIEKKRPRKWIHLIQIFYVLRDLLTVCISR